MLAADGVARCHGRAAAGQQFLEAPMTVPVRSGDHDMGEARAGADRLGEFRVKLLRHHQKPGPAVLEHEAVIILGQQRVDGNRDHAGLDRAEEGGRPIDAVEQADENALLAADVERAQRAAEAVDPRGEIAIGPAPARIDIGDFLAAPGVQIVFEDGTSEIVVARDRINGRGRSARCRSSSPIRATPANTRRSSACRCRPT